MTELLMWKFVVNTPTVVLIEFDGPSIGLDHPQAKGVMSTTAYFAFGVGD